MVEVVRWGRREGGRGGSVVTSKERLNKKQLKAGGGCGGGVR